MVLSAHSPVGAFPLAPAREGGSAMGQIAAWHEEWNDWDSGVGELACVLDGAPPFRGVPFRVLEDVASRAVTIAVDRGRVFLPDTEPGAGSAGEDAERRVYVILLGWCKVVRHLADGRQAVLDVKGPGALVGEEALAGFPVGPLPGAVALSRCELASIAVGSLLAVAARHRSLQLALARYLGERLIAAEVRLVERNMPVERRLVEALSRLGGSIRRPVTRHRTVDHDEEHEDDEFEHRRGDWGDGPALGQGDLASLVGASRETVNRALAALAARGLVAMDGGCPTLIDRAAAAVA